MATAATAAPATPAPAPPIALTRAGIPPPIAMLWAAAKRLPAATLPTPACNPAAIEPIESKGLDVASIVRQEGHTSNGPGNAEANNAQHYGSDKRSHSDTGSSGSCADGQSC
jgi:hypothetical protein